MMLICAVAVVLETNSNNIPLQCLRNVCCSIMLLLIILMSIWNNGQLYHKCVFMTYCLCIDSRIKSSVVLLLLHSHCFVSVIIRTAKLSAMNVYREEYYDLTLSSTVWPSSRHLVRVASKYEKHVSSVASCCNYHIKILKLRLFPEWRLEQVRRFDSWYCLLKRHGEVQEKPAQNRSFLWWLQLWENWRNRGIQGFIIITIYNKETTC